MTGRFRNAIAALFRRSRRDEYLEQYVVRQLGRGTPLEEVLNDPYVRNRTTETERTRLLDRPEIAAAVRRHTAEERGLT
jgi:hypothetical protein